MDFDFALEPGKKQLRTPCSEIIKPLVSIITPFYNAGKYFPQTYQSVVNQTFPWFEWIIVNDGSTNQEDVNILEDYASRDSRIHVYHKDNGGISTGRNLAVKMSSTDIIIPLDADDLIVPTYAECLYWGLYYNLDYDWCYSNNIGFQNLEYTWNYDFDGELLKTYNFLVYSAAIRKSAILAVGGYEEGTKHFYEDWHMWLRLIAAGFKPMKISLYGFWYRRMDTGVLSMVNKDPAIRKRADKLIEMAADSITQVPKAKVYPYLQEKPRIGLADRIHWELGLSNQKYGEKKNLMLLIPWMEMGGADVFNLNLVQGLDKEAFHISILTTMKGTGSWRQRFEEYVDEIFELPSFLELHQFLPFVDYFIQTRNVDTILLSNSYLGYYMLPWLRKTYPKLILVDYVHMEEWYWKNGGYARTAGVFGDILDKTFTCNERTRKVLIQDFHCDENKVKTLYIGTDIDRFNAELVPRGTIREKYQIGSEKWVILFPCRMHPQKRPFLMLEIAKRLKEIGVDFCILVVGGGDQLEEVKSKSIQMGMETQILFVGEQQNMPKFYQDSDMTLICSIKEGVALTAYESLSMGTPVVSTNVGGQSELITEDVGVLVPLYQDESLDFDNRNFQDVEVMAFVNAIIELRADRVRYLNLCNKGRERMFEFFSIQQMIKNITTEFCELEGTASIALREDMAINLKKMDRFVDDSLSTAIENQLFQNTLDEIWKERKWFENQYNEAKKHLVKELFSFKKTRFYLLLRNYWKYKLRRTKVWKCLRKLKRMVKKRGKSSV